MGDHPGLLGIFVLRCLTESKAQCALAGVFRVTAITDQQEEGSTLLVFSLEDGRSSGAGTTHLPLWHQLLCVCVGGGDSHRLLLPRCAHTYVYIHIYMYMYKHTYVCFYTYVRILIGQWWYMLLILILRRAESGGSLDQDHPCLQSEF